MDYKDKLRKFFQDPDWPLVEDILMKFITPLKDTSTINQLLPADEYKAQCIANQQVYVNITKFLRDIGALKKTLNHNEHDFS